MDISSVWMSALPVSGRVCSMPAANVWPLRHALSRSFDPAPIGLSSHLQKSGSRFAMRLRGQYRHPGSALRISVHWDSMPLVHWWLSTSRGRAWRYHQANHQTITSSCGWIIARCRKLSILTLRRIRLYVTLAVKSASKWSFPRCCG